MIEDEELYDEYERDDELCGDWSCYNCGGAGYIVTCIDDLCRGAGECMHGDGEIICPVCKRGPW